MTAARAAAVAGQRRVMESVVCLARTNSAAAASLDQAAKRAEDALAAAGVDLADEETARVVAAVLLYLSAVSGNAVVQAVVRGGGHVAVIQSLAQVPHHVHGAMAALLARSPAGSAPTQPPSVTCPVCGMTSHHPVDVQQGYCGNCHDWTRGKGPGRG